MKTKSIHPPSHKQRNTGRAQARARRTRRTRLRLRGSPKGDYLHPINVALGWVMREWREAHGLSQSAVAARAKLSRETLAGIERGKVWYSVCVAARVCDAMGLWVCHAMLGAARRIGRFPRGKCPVYWR